MKPYFPKTPNLIASIFRNQIWGFNTNKKNIYLTFDDGPTPEITEWVLAMLKQHNAKATFFCLGKNIEQHPAIFKKIIDNNHAIGNHTYSHTNGWKTSIENYISNTLQAEKILSKSYPNFNKLKLFRPPYGKIRSKQSKKIAELNYNIIMWSVISYDFDVKVSEDNCYNNVINNAKNGSIIVFHDSVKAFKNLKVVLPKVLEFYSKKGYNFKKIETIDIAVPDLLTY